MSDSATVSGGAGQPTPTGTVDFFLCQPAQVTAGGCEGSAGTKIGATKPLVAGAAASDSTANTTTVGKYCWRAEYSGDSFYNSSSHTNAASECFTTAAQAPVIETNSAPQGASIVPGTTASDQVSVGGQFGPAAGTVTFFLCGPGLADAATAAGCPSGGTQIGGAIALSGGSATSGWTTSAQTLGIGIYCWRSEYTPAAGSQYTAGSHTNAGTECFTTVKQPSHTVTSSDPTGGNVLPGTSVTDSATVSGGAGQPTPTGTVKFFLCQPATVTANAGDCSAGGSQVGSAVGLNGQGLAASSASTDTDTLGKHCWRAEYSGDSFYNSDSHTNATTECFTVEAATIKIVKDFVGAGKPVELRLDDVVKKTLSEDGDTGTPMVVHIGSHTVSETFVTSSDGDLYSTTSDCTNHGQPFEISAENPRSADISVVSGDEIVCTFTNTRKESAIQVDKKVSPTGQDVEPSDSASLPEPGGQFTYLVTVTNPASNADDMTITTLTDSVYGDLADVDNPLLDDTNCDELIGSVLEPGNGVSCTFVAAFKVVDGELVGNAGDSETDIVTVHATDESNRDEQADDSASVSLTDVKSILLITKSPSPGSLQEPGGNVTFTIVITNPLQFVDDGVTVTTVDSITLNDLTDTKFGDITAECGVAGVVLGPGQSTTCQITRSVSGTPSSPHQNTVTVTGADDDHPNGCVEPTEDSCKSASASATVTFTPQPPPPVQPKIDVAAQKSATPQVTLPSDGSGATITYNIAIVNNGPNTATNVTASDPAPSGVTFKTVTQQPTQGSCAVESAGALVGCSLGTLLPGQSVSFTVTATVTVTGTITNIVTTTGSGGPDTNPSNNTAQGQTLVVAAIKPPKPPVIKPQICNTVIVTPKVLKGNGKPQKIKVKVTQGKKGVAGVKVKITGPGISKTVKTGKNGKVTVTVKPSKPGIIKVEIQNKKACNTQRIGVVGVYEPPVTG